MTTSHPSPGKQVIRNTRCPGKVRHFKSVHDSTRICTDAKDGRHDGTPLPYAADPGRPEGEGDLSRIGRRSGPRARPPVQSSLWRLIGFEGIAIKLPRGIHRTQHNPSANTVDESVSPWSGVYMDTRHAGRFDNLAIVGGCGSSGTTLLAHLVSRHLDIASGPEFNCFNHSEIYDISELREALPSFFAGLARPAGYIDVPVFMTFREHYGITAELIETWMATSHSSQMFVAQLCSHLLARFGCRVFVEKSPSNAYCLAMASRTLPGIKLIHMIRDGRDVAVSLMNRDFNLFGAGSRWLYDTRQALMARAQPEYMEVRYEELVLDPEKTLAACFRHLGVGDDGDAVLHEPAGERGLYSEDWMARPEPRAWNQTPADPISAKSVGRYKAALSKRDLGMLYRIKTIHADANDADLPRSFGELLEFLRYETGGRVQQLPRSRTLETALCQAADYLRRLKRFLKRNYIHLPKRYTTI